MVRKIFCAFLLVMWRGVLSVTWQICKSWVLYISLTYCHAGLFTFENRKYTRVIMSVPRKWQRIYVLQLWVCVQNLKLSISKTDPFLQIKLKVGLLIHAMTASYIYMYFYWFRSVNHSVFTNLCFYFTVSTKGNCFLQSSLHLRHAHLFILLISSIKHVLFAAWNCVYDSLCFCSLMLECSKVYSVTVISDNNIWITY